MSLFGFDTMVYLSPPPMALGVIASVRLVFDKLMVEPVTFTLSYEDRPSRLRNNVPPPRMRLLTVNAASVVVEPGLTVPALPARLEASLTEPEPPRVAPEATETAEVSEPLTISEPAETVVAPV